MKKIEGIMRVWKDINYISEHAPNDIVEKKNVEEGGNFFSCSSPTFAGGNTVKSRSQVRWFKKKV